MYGFAPSHRTLTIFLQICWCIQLIPQIWTNWRRKKTEGLPQLMMLLWAISAFPLGVYAIVQRFNIPIQVQPQVFVVLCAICWGQILFYGKQWRAWTAALAASGLCAAIGGAQAVLIVTLRPPYERGVSWPITLIGVLAALMLALGLIPPYFELARRKGRVVGINLLFLFTDWLGAFLSLMSLVAQQSFDVLGGVQYSVCAALEVGIFLSHGIWLWRSRKTRKLAKEAHLSYDEFVDGNGAAEMEEETERQRTDIK